MIKATLSTEGSLKASVSIPVEYKPVPGPQGEIGPVGPQGIQGVKGDKGEQGVQGPKGDRGEQGIQGEKGATGSQGLQGPQGVKGDVGPQGIQGIQGEKGDKGDTGEQGPQGIDGNILQQEEIDKINDNIDYLHSLQYAPFAGANVKSDYSLAGKTKDMSIKGRTLQNLGSYYRIVGNEVKFSRQLTGTITIVNAYKSDNIYMNRYNISTNAYLGATPIRGNVYKIDIANGEYLGNLYDNNIAIAPEELIKDVIILEGDHTNTPLSELPYVEGIQGVGEEVENGYEVGVKSCGKNLFGGYENAYKVGDENPAYIDVYNYCKNLIGLTIPQDGLTFKADVKTKDFGRQGEEVFHYGFDINFIFTDGTDGWNDFTYSNIGTLGTVDKRVVYNMKKYIGKTISDSKFCRVFTRGSVGTFEISNIEIIIGNDTGTEKSPYQEDALTYTLDEQLHSLPNGVCDEIKDGKLIRRVGKVVVDGSYVSFTSDSYKNETSNACLFKLKTESPFKRPYGGLISSNYPVYNSNLSIWENKNIHNGISGVNSGYDFSIKELNSKTGILQNDNPTQVREKFVNYFNSNPTTVYYELETPVITDLDKPTNLDTYVGITHITSSNTVLPTIEGKIRTDLASALAGAKAQNQALQDRMGCLECDFINMANTMNRLMATTLLPKENI